MSKSDTDSDQYSCADLMMAVEAGDQESVSAMLAKLPPRDRLGVETIIKYRDRPEALRRELVRLEFTDAQIGPLPYFP